VIIAYVELMSVTGIRNRLCAVRPPSYKVAARAVVLTMSTTSPQLRRSDNNVSIRKVFPLPPGLPSMNDGAQGDSEWLWCWMTVFSSDE